MARRTHQPGWPHLGYRFNELRRHAGSGGLLTCDAVDLLLGRRVTLRLCTGEAAPHERETFEAEAAALTQLDSHPHVVSLHDRIQIGDAELLVLDRCESYPSTSTAPLEPAAAARLGVELAGALESAHRLGLGHGRVEPATLYRDGSGPVMLAGFTLRFGEAATALLASVSAHTAPELLLGQAATPATDVYGLASTLYELLCGHSAYRTFAGESLAALSLRILTGPMPAPDRVGLPFELVDVLGWAMAVDPGARPPGASWFAEELGRIERAQGWPRTSMQIGAAQRPPRLRAVGARHRAASPGPAT
jgi:serine/threonine-protein kinase PknK